MTAFIAYLRVSTARQGHSGLGIDAQKETVAKFVKPCDELVATYVEIESGRNCARPQLRAALAECRLRRATLVIAKIDRLARNVAFLATLMEGDVPVVAADMPQADKLTWHVLAAVAEHEARLCSSRTKEALAAAKKRGVVLGGFRGYCPTDEDRAKAHAAQLEARRVRLAALSPILADIRANGATSLREIADGLNRRGIPAARGGRWQAAQVRTVLGRVAP